MYPYPDEVYPLDQLPAFMQERIWREVALPSPPARTVLLGSLDGVRPLVEMPSRGWHEWHWQRGIDPNYIRVAIPRAIRRLVIERDGLICGLCGLDVSLFQLQIDHILPVSLGGDNSLANLQVAHASCNASKGARI